MDNLPTAESYGKRPIIQSDVVKIRPPKDTASYDSSLHFQIDSENDEERLLPPIPSLSRTPLADILDVLRRLSFAATYVNNQTYLDRPVTTTVLANHMRKWEVTLWAALQALQDRERERIKNTQIALDHNTARQLVHDEELAELKSHYDRQLTKQMHIIKRCEELQASYRGPEQDQRTAAQKNSGTQLHITTGYDTSETQQKFQAVHNDDRGVSVFETLTKMLQQANGTERGPTTATQKLDLDHRNCAYDTHKKYLAAIEAQYMLKIQDLERRLKEKKTHEVEKRTMDRNAEFRKSAQEVESQKFVNVEELIEVKPKRLTEVNTKLRNQQRTQLTIASPQDGKKRKVAALAPNMEPAAKKHRGRMGTRGSGFG